MRNPAQRKIDTIAALFDRLGLKYGLDGSRGLFIHIHAVVLSYAVLGNNGEILSVIAKPSAPVATTDRDALLAACNARNRDLPFPKAYMVGTAGDCEVRTNISQLQAIVRMSIETNVSSFARPTGK